MHSFPWYIALVLLFGTVIFLAIPSESAEEDYLGTVGAATFPGDIGERIWLEYESAVSKLSNGNIKLRMLIRGETGGEESRLPALLRGRIDISSFSEAGMSRVVPEFSVLTAPYLFDSIEEVHFVVDNFLKEPFAARAKASGLKVLNWQDVGWLNIYGQKPLLIPKEVNGYRMRSMQSKASIHFLRAIGADVIHIQRTDLVSSLQTGLVEGGESSLVLYATGGEAEYATHLTFTRHSRQFGFSVVNRRWFEDLDETTQEILTDGFGPESEQRDLAAEVLKAEEKKLTAMGVMSHELTQDQRDAFKAQVLPGRIALVEDIGGAAPQIMEVIAQGKAAFARQSQ
ncbi:MAG: TRAP transporter substrate-binding protein [Rhodospirillaceae bacterium]